MTFIFSELDFYLKRLCTIGFGRNDGFGWVEDEQRQATARTTATADPYGMTNKRTNNDKLGLLVERF
jgi:hypothetical protein